MASSRQTSTPERVAESRRGAQPPPRRTAGRPSPADLQRSLGNRAVHAEGQGTVAANGFYLIWGTWREGDTVRTYHDRVLRQWVSWRFGGSLSAASRGQILSRLLGMRYEVLQTGPAPGTQYHTVIRRDLMRRITGIAERDPQARQADEREEAAGLLAGPPIAETAGSAGTEPAERTEPAEPPATGSEFEGGLLTANAPAIPAALSGPDIAPTRAIGTYLMRLDYSIAGSDQLSQVVEAMNYVHYHWELYRVTDLVQGGLEEQMMRARGRPTSAADRVGRLDATGRRAEQAAETLAEETMASARELASPVDAAHGGTPAELITRAQANFASLELTPASAIVSMGGVALGALADLYGGDFHEQEVPWPATEGIYMVRCIAQPAVHGSRRRAASVAARLVQVRPVASLARAALELPHALADEKELELELARRSGASPERLAQLQTELANLRIRASGAATDVIALEIREREAQIAQTPEWQRRDLERQLGSLREQQEHARARTDRMEGQIYRPEAAFVSRLDGQTYPLLLQLGQVRGAQGEVWRLSDVSTANGRQWTGRGASATEAVRNAARLMSRGNEYGPGSLSIRFSADAPFEAGELPLTNVSTGEALARRRLADLAAVLVVLGLLVPGVGEIAAVVGAAVAADRLLDRWQNGSLRMDADTVMDIIGLFGAAAQGVAVVGRVRVLQHADRFVLASTAADQQAILGALRSVHDMSELAERAGAVASWGGFAIGQGVVLGGFLRVNDAELSGRMSHAEARRARAQIFTSALREATLQFAPAPRARAAVGGEPTATPSAEHPPIRPVAGEPHGPAGEARHEPVAASGPAPRRPMEPGRLASLERELGDLAGRVRIVENPDIGSSVLVRYLDGVLHIEMGPEAGVRRLRAHLETARLLRQYEGPIGLIRRLVDRIRSLLRLTPGYGTRGFEARLEVRKLTEIKTALEQILRDIHARAMRMSGEELVSAAERERLQRELSAVEMQLAQHQELVNSYEPGRGFVAALDPATMSYFASVEPSLRTLVRALNRGGRPDLIATMAEVARLEAAGRNIRGFAAWVRESVSRARGTSEAENVRQAVDKASELAEMLRLYNDVRNDPSQVVRFNPGQAGARSFDIHVEGAPGAAPGVSGRHVEVKEHEGIPYGSRSLNKAITRGAGKVPPTVTGPTGQGRPSTEPTREVTVVVPWFLTGSRDLPTESGMRRVDASGNYQAVGGMPPTPRGAVGSIPADLLADLRAGRVGGVGVDRLDVVNIVSSTGTLLWRFGNLGTAAAPNWQRTR